MNKNFIVGVVAMVFVVAGGVWWFNKQSQNNPQAQQPFKQAELIQYRGSSADPVKEIKTIPLPDYPATIHVSDIGILTGGQYKDKTLALATFDYSDMSAITFAYFISDNVGNPIAWDPTFLQDNRGVAPFKGLLGLTPRTQQSLDFLPEILSMNGNIIANDQRKTIFSVYNPSLIPSVEVVARKTSSVGLTETGWQIVREVNPENNPKALLPGFSYYAIFPFGKAIQVSAEPDFVNSDDVPQLTWTVGTTTVASYRYGQYAYGWEDCYAGISTAQLRSAFVQTGMTNKGDAVSEINAQKYPKVYECLHLKTSRYVYDSTTKNGAYQDTVSYADFILSHPMFFWKHPYGDLIAFVRSDVVPSAEKAKPVIYLYPQKPEKVSVKVSPIGGFVKTDPDYGSGWVVDATPNGVITNLKDGKQYQYLFWEGGKDGVVETPKQGFVVAKGDISSALNEKLSQFGLSKQERADFLEFWAPKLSRAPYYFITFISKSEIDRTAPMVISPQPDTVIRVLMDYKPLTQLISVEPLAITSTERKGFTVVEWGGIVRD